MVQVGSQTVGPIGFGLMGLTWRATPPSQEQAFETLRAALKNGCTLWNGGEFYGKPEYNSLVLLERYLEKYPDDASKFVLNIKGGMNLQTFTPDGSVEGTRRTLDDCIKQLNGRKKIDQFEFARRDQTVPMEVTFGVLNEYIEAGKLGGVALSEVRAETIHEAVKHTKVVAVEAELSLFETGPLENGVAAACAQYGIPLVAYSPISRGLLTGQIRKFDDLPADSMQRKFPRFQPQNFEINMQLVAKVEELARAKGCTAAQLAINWVRSLSRRPGMPTIIPIPGATTAARVEENSKVIDLGDSELAQIDAILAKFTTAGERYPAGAPTNT
ncbi:aldo/keto reductase family protein [Aspergillus puulaauensis]|uniref:Pyridoxine 4-dehydrogenase n=1 Tax=Aspergillus puulaauensis TaxID=1220207 RepID=A0A7R7XL43_9EURO|nr:pyridoxine 4-dehydrogenase [Aspergillus puulaauensis]BCS23491.1 pyridoxine 4-dehydrogenase [Aspergillus puulaauensis]